MIDTTNPCCYCNCGNILIYGDEIVKIDNYKFPDNIHKFIENTNLRFQIFQSGIKIREINKVNFIQGIPNLFEFSCQCCHSSFYIAIKRNNALICPKFDEIDTNNIFKSGFSKNINNSPASLKLFWSLSPSDENKTQVLHSRSLYVQPNTYYFNSQDYEDFEDLKLMFPGNKTGPIVGSYREPCLLEQ